ncbi:serine hydrolase domain-containing protein [Mucilaginibacter litoreus]|uniref:Serine hydrolase domain-containing protein n=1 Tax=Mucilaginibacter litoreus TaxID=1048221 RepID=A0ABW3AQW5_9SPHI
MKNIFFLCLLTCVSLVTEGQDRSQQLDHLIGTYFKLQKFNGTVLVTQKGRILLKKGYGYQDVKTREPNSAHTVYQIASVTKCFTSTLALKMIELKKLKLTDPLSKFFTGFPKGDSITIRHLLSHTSGISDHEADSTAKDKTDIERLKARPLDFAPGTDWRYSNSGYIVLGHILEKVSGMSYYDAIRKYIFEPAGMRESAFDFAALKSPHKATGYWVFPEDASAEPAKLINYDQPKAAGAIYSTVDDLYRFHRALQTGQLVSTALLKQAYTPVALNYGYGWIIDSADHKKVVSHSGDIWGFKAEFARVPEDDICVVMLSNAEDLELHAITFKILAIVNGRPYQFPAQNKATLDEATLNGYTGKYELRPGEFIEIKTHKGRLLATTGTTQEMYCQQKDHFLLDNGRDQLPVAFQRDSAGAVISLSFRKGDQQIICKKVK